MIRLPMGLREEYTFDEAVDIVKATGQGDLLGGMLKIDSIHRDYILSGDMDDDNFLENWHYEFNAYNVVYANMAKLFK